MSAPRLFRRRLIPDEIIALDGDEIVSMDASTVVTKWTALKPRLDFARGASCYYMDEGYKVSKMITASGDLLYYYCDIIETERTREGLVFIDLLFDVVIETDGRIRTLDLGEGAQALRQGIISRDRLCAALETLDKLLAVLYSGGLPELIKPIESL